MGWDLDLSYREHLTSGDLALLAEVAGGQPLVRALSSAAVEQAVLRPDAAFDVRRAASPFLVFAVAVHRVADRLAGATYVEEWVGPRRRVPVFAVEPLRRLVADQRRRFFFVELLASYTHVVSGSTWTPTRRGWRRRRFSELDPVQLAGLLESLPPPERPGVLRRLGDLALFLTGVFPDHTATSGAWGPIAEARLLRSADLPADRSATDARPAVELLELLGARWYQLAARLSPVPTASVEMVRTIAGQFVDARRFLNVVTDSYLFPLREQWFGRPAA